jgi:hypothetical protein
MSTLSLHINPLRPLHICNIAYSPDIVGALDLQVLIHNGKAISIEEFARDVSRIRDDTESGDVEISEDFGAVGVDDFGLAGGGWGCGNDFCGELDVDAEFGKSGHGGFLHFGDGFRGEGWAGGDLRDK